MDRDNDLQYELRLMNTQAATGFFACVPDPDPGLGTGSWAVESATF